MLDDRILRLPEVIKMTGISRSRIYVFMDRAADPFPRQDRSGSQHERVGGSQRYRSG